MFQKLRNFYNQAKIWFWALPVWKRAILSSLVGAFGGSSVIGFFNRYALYYHAVKQNFRVPVEGVEYLDLAVSIMSFAIITISIIGTIAVYSVLNFIADLFTRLIIRDKNKKAATVVKRIIVVLQSILGIAGFLSGGSSLFDSITSLLEFDSTASTKQFIYVLIYLAIPIVIFIVLGVMFAKKESARKQVTLILVLLGIFTITASLFNQTIYKKFLRQIQFGGELPIKVEYRAADNTQAFTSGLLLIRTNKSITIKNKGNIEEIPNTRISKLIFEQ